MEIQNITTNDILENINWIGEDFKDIFKNFDIDEKKFSEISIAAADKLFNGEEIFLFEKFILLTNILSIINNILNDFDEDFYNTFAGFIDEEFVNDKVFKSIFGIYEDKNDVLLSELYPHKAAFYILMDETIDDSNILHNLLKVGSFIINIIKIGED